MNRSAALLLVCMGCGGALAQSGPQSGSTDTVPEPAPRLTRIDGDVTNRPELANVNAPPGSRIELSGASQRWWLGNGKAALGVGLGTVGYVVRPLNDADHGEQTVIASSPMVTVGMRYRTTDASALYADVSGAHHLGTNRSDAYFGKVGVEWKASGSQWSALQGGLGLKLDADSKMTVRLRHGVLGLYLRNTF